MNSPVLPVSRNSCSRQWAAGISRLVTTIARPVCIAAFSFLLASLLYAKSFPGPGGNVTLESRSFGSVEFVPLLDLAEALGLVMRWQYEAQKIELRNHVITLDFMSASRFVLVDKQDTVKLSTGIVFSKGEPFVPVSFLTATLKPYYSRLSKARKSPAVQGSHVIIIDPGHGGAATGAIGYKGLKECDLVLDISKRVRDILTKKGYTVRMTRESNVNVPLISRADIANKAGASVLVSIHANSVDRGSALVSGSETFYLSKAQKASEREAERIENSAIKYDINAKWSGLSSRLKKIFMSSHFERTRQKSRSLAENVQKRVSRAAVGKNRGVKTANFEVLRNAYCPACLVEVGFLDHPTDASQLMRSSYKQKIADAIAQGIIDYLGK